MKGKSMTENYCESGKWRETTYVYSYNGETYTEVGASTGLSSFDNFQKAKGITGAKLINAMTSARVEAPSPGAIIEAGSEI